MFKDSASRRLVQGPRLLGLRLPGFVAQSFVLGGSKCKDHLLERLRREY